MITIGEQSDQGSLPLLFNAEAVNAMAWKTSTRSKRLPHDWPTRRRRVQARAHDRCQARTHAPGCDGRGSECDHIIPGDDHDLANLQWLNHFCHKAKTERENAEANRQAARLRRRPAETHPGMIHAGSKDKAK